RHGGAPGYARTCGVPAAWKNLGHREKGARQGKCCSGGQEVWRLRLAELAAVLPDYLWKEGEPGDAVVSGISYDSRRVAPGHLFVCWRGQRHDGHQFAREAVDRRSEEHTSELQ